MIFIFRIFHLNNLGKRENKLGPGKKKAVAGCAFNWGAFSAAAKIVYVRQGERIFFVSPTSCREEGGKGKRDERRRRSDDDCDGGRGKAMLLQREKLCCCEQFLSLQAATSTPAAAAADPKTLIYEGLPLQNVANFVLSRGNWA